MPASGSRSAQKRTEKPYRGFNEVPVLEVGYQHIIPDESNSRFQNWRLNLTGLSRYLNLYFVAYGDEIHVYEPQFPDQRIADETSLIIDPPNSRSGLRGFINRRLPHAVNHLLIDDFGEEEIMLCACDDGDILAFHTASILAAVERRHELATPDSILDHDVRPFFHINVGISAWGLAVQRDSRMIAVSANSHDVTVFALAMIAKDSKDGQNGEKEDMDYSDEDMEDEASPILLTEEWYEPDDVPDGGSLHLEELRSNRNVRLTLRGHGDNIPSIAFYSADAGPEMEHYLLSTDISGMTVLWDIQRRVAVKVLRPAEYPRTFGSSLGLPENSGWGILQLDKRAFSRAKTVAQAYGLCHLIGHDRKLVCDISASRDMVKNSGRWHLGDDTSSENTQSSSDTEEPGRDNEDSTDQLGELQQSFLRQSSTSDFVIGDFEELELDLPDDMEDDERNSAAQQRIREYPIFSLRGSSENSSLPDSLSSPVCILHQQAISLLQSPNFDNLGPKSPVVSITDPLFQRTHEAWEGWLRPSDRMALYAQIPELGVVIVGSPKGRVAIMTLHQIEIHSSHPELGPPDGPMYTMRLDHLLPFSTQEAEHQRPAHLLVGLAVSPMQASSRRDAERSQWRLMLMYGEHTVLSYCIGREEVGSGDDVLIV